MPPIVPAPPRRGGLFWARFPAPGAAKRAEMFCALALAVELLGGNVDAGAQVDDLRRAGWVVPPARRSKSGGATIEVAKRFDHPEQLGQVMAELSGPGGPLQGFRLERRRSLTRTRYRLSGRADLRAGGAVAGFGNV